METSCTYVASGDWLQQAAIWGPLIAGFGFLATSRGRQLVRDLISDGEETPEPQSSTANA